ncbi:hypothetical protein [Pectinatus sottacetonis]|uniref:hypothetical protein n=1 Tax=Pectinatus sottacetonis TaxID=1002795 RepID=UPI0018C57644|nr:hypothetical protein [Pectinatus sottacetonis]
MFEILEWLTKYKKDIIYIVIILIILLIGFFLYKTTHKAQTITIESQSQAETPAGIELAAKNAQIKMQQEQITESAKQIAELKNKPPEKVIQTVVKEVPTVVKEQQEKSGADFAIVTDKDNPDQEYNFSNADPNEAVNLNQYNVFAYKKVLHTVSYAPNSLKDWEPKQIGASVAKKITKYNGSLVKTEI